MRIPATINGQQYVLDYGTNPRGQVAGVAIYSADGLTDLSFSLDGTLTEYKAWDIAIQHNATACLVAEHVPTPAVPAIPALVAVPHVLESTPKKWAAIALNTDAQLSAIHAVHVAAIAAKSNKTSQSALVWAYVSLKQEVAEAFTMAKHAGGLLFAFHGSTAFEVAA